mmetsp:Transcript_12164/g.21075  ORF Transcript_12164/g.21075 Transcript_12164/m.21075 type:complete len:81 (-) Transcript_12164:1-243(-)
MSSMSRKNSFERRGRTWGQFEKSLKSVMSKRMQADSAGWASYYIRLLQQNKLSYHPVEAVANWSKYDEANPIGPPLKKYH